MTAQALDFAPPPLTRWGRVWRVLAAVAAGFVLWAGSADTTPGSDEGLVVRDLVLGALAIGIMTQRRRWPVPVAVTVVLVSTFSATAVAAAGICVISLATRRRWSESVGVALLWVVTGVVSAELYPPAQEEAGSVPWWVSMGVSTLVIAICVAIGSYIGARRELIATLHARAEVTEREQAAREEQARTTERSRIAREMHDVLAHRISLVAMHSGALAFRTDLSAQETAQTARIIRDNAHLALAELREVLGVLRSVDPGVTGTAPDRPQPTLAALSELVEETRAAGTPLEVTVEAGTKAGLARLPESTGRTAYRILQEGLTNARKHAPGAPVRVRIAGAPGERLTLEVRNAAVGTLDPARLPTSGMGLTGLRERATIAGGELTHRVDRAGDFVLRAWLPWPR